MLSIFGRCSGGGSLSAVHDDDGVPAATDASSSGVSSGAAASAPSRGSASFNCAAPCSSRYQPNDATEPLPDSVVQSLNRTVPELLRCISSPPPADLAEGTSPYDRRKTVREFNARRTGALQKLYDLTKKGSERNRVPLVCSTEKQWDVIGVLSAALLASTEADPEKESRDERQSKGKPSVDEDRRLIVWTLNNLSVPYENKSAIALGEHSGTLLQALTQVIQSNLPETYLCCICLLNLTFLADAIRPVAFHVPSSTGGKPPYSPSRKGSRRLRSRSSSGQNLWSEGEGRISEICGLVLGNPASLIRVVERMMVTNAPFLLSEVQSVQGEAIRWACGFVRNVTYDGAAAEDGSQGGGDSLSGNMGREGSIPDEAIEEVCLLVSRTEIPRLMVQFVRDSPRPTVKWTRDSLEDICLGALCNLAKFQASQEALKRAGAVKGLESIEALPGIHGYRARAIRCSLGALPMQFA
ncbi:hypothetical protein ACHAXT_002208 [Thalassiosira profunda]